MKVLIACEFSGRVRDAFRAKGHDALSCDLLPTEVPGPHYEGDVRDILHKRWDLVIAHPDCTYHTNAGVRWYTTIPKNPRADVTYGPARWQKWEEAVAFFRLFTELDHVERVCIENPVMHGASLDAVGDYTQTIQPWMFGHKRLKRTCLWLKGLMPLVPSRLIQPPRVKDFKTRADYDKEYRLWAEVHQESPGPERWRNRSRTYTGIARAMADQWG